MILVLWGTLWASLGGVSAYAETLRCVVIFDEPSSLLTSIGQSKYGGDPETRILTNSVPTDLTQCSREGVQEIVILAHTAPPAPEGSLTQGLVFQNPVGPIRFGKMVEAARQELVAVNQANEKFIQAYDHGDCDNKNIPQCRYYRYRVQALKAKQRKLAAIVAGYTENKYRMADLIPPIFFDIWLTILRQLQQKDQLRLKRIRIGACAAIELPQVYSAFAQILSEMNIEFDALPPSKTFSWLWGRNVATMVAVKKWL